MQPFLQAVGRGVSGGSPLQTYQWTAYTYIGRPFKVVDMVDTLSSKDRSERMSRVRGKNTSPEMRVRRLVHALGFRYRLHDGRLPGCPDLVFGSRRKVIFVHGCFWHRHGSHACKLARLPKSRLDFWLPKLDMNRSRDLRNQRRLRLQGWKCLILWECQLNDLAFLEKKITAFLTP